MKRSACLPLLLTAVLLCSCGSNAKKAPTRPDQFISEEQRRDLIISLIVLKYTQSTAFATCRTARPSA